MQAIKYKMGKQQGPMTSPRELYSISYNKPIMEKNKKQYIYIYIYIYMCVCVSVCVCMTESLCSTAVSSTTL